MSRKPSSSCCAICEYSNRASICSICVSHRLNAYRSHLKALKNQRDNLYARLGQALVDKGKAEEQVNRIVVKNEKLLNLKEQLRRNKEQFIKGKSKVEKISSDLKAKYDMIELANAALQKSRAEQLEKFYPNLICTQSLGLMAITSELLHKQSVVIKQISKLFPQRRVTVDGDKKDSSEGQYDQICNARLPKGLDPHSVPSEELSTSLGYMVQLLNLCVRCLAGPALHNAGFAGSCSRIWQRDSYWNARPSSRCNEYPLFIPRQNYCSATGETSWSDKSSNDFGVTSIESVKRIRADPTGSFNYSSASPHSLETHKELQKGIALLKKSVACLTAYCYNSLYLEIPPDTSTFEAFAKLISTLSSSKEMRSVLSLRMATSRSSKQVQKMNISVWNMNSAVASSTLLESAHTQQKNISPHHNFPNLASSFLFSAEMNDVGKNESLIEGWDLVEHPTFPPPPSQTEDVEHWTRAMFVDATKH